MTPIINIQSPEPEPPKMSHLTIDTRLFNTDSNGNSSPRSPAGHSTHSSTTHGLADNYHAYALFTPLLFFMIQYLDPYLAARPTQQDNLNYSLTTQANSIHNFHRALSYMMSCKTDLYLDILQVISHSTSEVKFRGCQILFYYYFASVGHVIVADPLPLLGTREELEILDKRRKEQEYEETRQMHGSRSSHQLSREQTATPDEDHLEEHHVWYPYIFHQKQQQSDSSTSTFPIMVHDDVDEAFCKECFKPIKGFGLRCFQCKESVHYNCSSINDTQGQGLLTYLKAGGIQKVVATQFCRVPPQPRFRDMVNRGLLGWTMKSNSAIVGFSGHTFLLVNLYTLTICACCRLPLWGISQQAYRCAECNRFVHPHCLAEAEEKNSFWYDGTKSTFQGCSPKQPLLESDVNISQVDFSRSLIEFYQDAFPQTNDFLDDKSYEEVGTILNVLLLQESIIQHGITAGCLIISRDSDDPLLTTPTHQYFDTYPTSATDAVESHPSSHCPSLAKAIQFCLTYLRSGNCRGSPFLNDFFSNQSHNVDECLLSREEYLSHLGAMMKCLTTSFSNSGSVIESFADKRRSTGDARGFLQVTANSFTNAWEEEEDDEFGEGQIPSENLDRSVLLSWVMTNLNFKSKKAAEMLLQHMRNLGLFERFDASPILFHASKQQDQAIQCIFPVPYAIDCSYNVEALLNSIAACLQDVDLSINECGLLLLVRRCWPDPFMSSYTTQRLVHAIVSWTFDEDERLLALHAELTAGSKSSPHQNTKQNRWAQAALLARMKVGADRQRQSAFPMGAAAGGGVSSGASNIYVTTRAALKDRYIVRWLETIHDMDPEAYTDMLYHAMDNIIDSKREDCQVPNWGEASDTEVKKTIEIYMISDLYGMIEIHVAKV